MNCPNCGNTVLDGAAFCNHCGAPLVNASEMPATHHSQQQAYQQPTYQQPVNQQPPFQQPNYQQQAYQQPGYIQPVGNAPSKSKVAAGLLGIFLGALGIHKFYLGYTKAGIIMLVVSLLTFGIGAVVMEMIGLIEGILYLTKSDQDFYRIYELGQKQWF